MTAAENRSVSLLCPSLRSAPCPCCAVPSRLVLCLVRASVGPTETSLSPPACVSTRMTSSGGGMVTSPTPTAAGRPRGIYRVPMHAAPPAAAPHGPQQAHPPPTAAPLPSTTSSPSGCWMPLLLRFIDCRIDRPSTVAVSHKRYDILGSLCSVFLCFMFPCSRAHSSGAGFWIAATMFAVATILCI